VGIDGITASGKSTFARELAAHLRASGRQIIYTTIDGFHNPKLVRYKRGRQSPEGYFFDAYNYTSIIDGLLVPLGKGGNLRYFTKAFDLYSDQEIVPEFQPASKDAIVIVDGSFALRKELYSYWDYKLYLKVPFEVAEERASVRDSIQFGSRESAREITRSRYHAAHLLHIKENDPEMAANRVIENTNPEAACFLR
jgi:uridine kinase